MFQPTIKDFAKFLCRQENNKIFPTCVTNACPLGQYIQCHYKENISLLIHHYYIDTTPKKYKKWMRTFIEEIDSLEDSYVTKHKALEILRKINKRKI